MATTDLRKVKICVTALGNRIVIARFGKDETLSLDQRDAGHDFWRALLQYAFEGKTPEPGQGAEVTFGSEDGSENYTVTIKRAA